VYRYQVATSTAVDVLLLCSNFRDVKAWPCFFSLLHHTISGKRCLALIAVDNLFSFRKSSRHPLNYDFVECCSWSFARPPHGRLSVLTALLFLSCILRYRISLTDIMQLLLSTCVAALLILQASAQLRSPKQVGRSPKQVGRSPTQVGRSLSSHSSSVQSVAIDLGECTDFALMAGSTATCAGANDCTMIGGFLGVSPGTAHTGNFVPASSQQTTPGSVRCATDGLAALNSGKSKAGAVNMVAEMGGLTFGPGVYTHGSAINIALASPVVTLDAGGNTDAVFIFVAGSTLTTCAGSKIVLKGGAKAENVYWVLGTALTMGADSILVGNVLAGSAITIGTNGKICGRAIAQTAVTCATACTVEIDDSAATTCNQPVPEEDDTVPVGDVNSEDVCAAISQCMLKPVPVPDDPNLSADLNGLVLSPGTYTAAAAATLTGTLTLEGTGDWIFIIGAAFSTAASSRMVFAPGSYGTVTWVVTGAISTGANSIAIGTMQAVGAITLGAGAHSGPLEAEGAITLGANAKATSATTTAATTLGAGAQLLTIVQLAAGSLPADLGGQTLGPGTYSTSAAATLTGTLTLDPNMLDSTGNLDWIFNINGAFSTAAASQMIMKLPDAGNFNGTVIFNVNGAISTGAASVAIGTLKASPGAITTGANAKAETLDASGAITTGADSKSGDLIAGGAITLGANAYAVSAATAAATTKGAGASLGSDTSVPASGSVGTLPAELGGVVLTQAGTYTAAAAVGMTGKLTLMGPGNWIFEIPGGALTTAAASQMVRSTATGSLGTVTWIVGGAISLGASSVSFGSMQAGGAITTGAGAKTGNLEAVGAITLGAGGLSYGNLVSTGGAVTFGANAHAASAIAAGATTFGANASVNSATYYQTSYQ
jgi:hypothetical protein